MTLRQIMDLVSKFAGIVLFCGYFYSFFEFPMGAGGFVFNSFILLASIIWIGLRFGIFSLPFVLSFILYSVALVPGAARYLGFQIYSAHNIPHQLKSELTDLYLFTIILSMFVLLVYFICWRNLNKRKLSSFKFDTSVRDLNFPFYLGIALYLICCYGMEPGRTLLNVDYTTVLEDRDSTAAANLFGVFSVVFWILLYLKYRFYSVNKIHFDRQKVFLIATVIGITWLFLHARRSELIGYILIGFYHSKALLGRVNYKFTTIGIAFVLAVYLLGFARGSSSLSNVDVGLISGQAFSTKGGNVQERDIANMPSGLGNIAETMQTTLYHFEYRNADLLLGETIFSYPKKLVPSNLLSILGVAKPQYYHNLVLMKYSYNGGTYIFAPAYGNFGIFGVLLATLIFAWMITKSTVYFTSGDTYKAIFASLLIFYMIKIVWYGPIPFLKSAYTSLIFVFLVSVLFIKRPTQHEIPSLTL